MAVRRHEGYCANTAPPSPDDRAPPRRILCEHSTAFARSPCAATKDTVQTQHRLRPIAVRRHEGYCANTAPPSRNGRAPRRTKDTGQTQHLFRAMAVLRERYCANTAAAMAAFRGDGYCANQHWLRNGRVPRPILCKHSTSFARQPCTATKDTVQTQHRFARRPCAATKDTVQTQHRLRATAVRRDEGYCANTAPLRATAVRPQPVLCEHSTCLARWPCPTTSCGSSLCGRMR